MIYANKGLLKISFVISVLLAVYCLFTLHIFPKQFFIYL